MDKSKIHPKYYKVYDQVMESPLLTQAQKENLYKIWVEINKHPQKDWKTKKVLDKLDSLRVL